MELDIIIPIYNAIDTLRTPLDSIREQKVSFPFQVVLIDDFSECNYQEILEEYQKSFPIVYYRLSENVGSGLAREKGLEISHSPLVTFMDADDSYIQNTSLETLYQSIHDTDYDCVIAGEFNDEANVAVLNESDLHGKIYKRNFIEENDIHFNHTRYHEDNYFNNLVLLLGAKYQYLLYNVYRYHFNPNSLTKKDKEKEFQRLEILLSNYRELLRMNPMNDDNIDRILHFITSKYRYYNRIYFNVFSEDERKQFQSWLEIYDPENCQFLGIQDLDSIETIIIDAYNKRRN